MKKKISLFNILVAAIVGGCVLAIFFVLIIASFQQPDTILQVRCDATSECIGEFTITKEVSLDVPPMAVIQGDELRVYYHVVQPNTAGMPRQSVFKRARQISDKKSAQSMPLWMIKRIKIIDRTGFTITLPVDREPAGKNIAGLFFLIKIRYHISYVWQENRH